MLHAEDIRRRIEAAYLVSENQLGWRFLYSPAEVLNGAEVAFIGLNPGGTNQPTDHAVFAMEHGSAFVDEKWATFPKGQSPLQVQVRALFANLNVRPEEVLAGNLIPFRSPDWRRLNNKQLALEFRKELWNEVLRETKPRLVIGMGGEIAKHVPGLLGMTSLESTGIGWGTVSGVRGVTKETIFVGLPHLSRFRIINRETSENGLRELFGAQWNPA